MRTSFPASRAFTLIELLVVLALMATIAGVAVVRMDGVSDRSRLQTAVTQCAGAIKLAQVQARASGAPRRVVYDPDGAVNLQRPILLVRTWRWDEGVRFDLPRSVRVENVLTEESGVASIDRNGFILRVGPDGRIAPHVVLFALGEHRVGALISGFNEPKLLTLDRPCETLEQCLAQRESHEAP